MSILDYIEDYTSASLDDFATSLDMVPLQPITSRFPWNLEAVDGTPEFKGYLTHMPHPQQAGHNQEEDGGNKMGGDRGTDHGRHKP